MVGVFVHRHQSGALHPARRDHLQRREFDLADAGLPAGQARLRLGLRLHQRGRRGRSAALAYPLVQFRSRAGRAQRVDLRQRGFLRPVHARPHGSGVPGRGPDRWRGPRQQFLHRRLARAQGAPARRGRRRGDDADGAALLHLAYRAFAPGVRRQAGLRDLGRRIRRRGDADRGVRQARRPAGAAVLAPRIQPGGSTRAHGVRLRRAGRRPDAAADAGGAARLARTGCGWTLRARRGGDVASRRAR